MQKREEDIFSLMQELAACSGLAILLRMHAKSQWDTLSLALPYIPVAYSSAMIDYQLAYWTRQEEAAEIVDISMVLLHDQKPCGLWPLTLRWSASSGFHVGSNGGNIEPPLFVGNLAKKTVKQLTVNCQELLNRLQSTYEVEHLVCLERFSQHDIGFSDWYDGFLRAGATVNIRHELLADLTLDLESIWSSIRRRYRSMINAGIRLWEVNVLDYGDSVVWNEYRNLHLSVAGRVTRSDDSWSAQHSAIIDGDAFLIYLRDNAGRMIGGGLFYYTRDEGVYAVGAYDRNMFDKPIGHVVQYRAIELMKQKGVRWYRIGQRPFIAESPVPTAKELAIADFKQGFSTHLVPRYLISISKSGI